MTVWVNGKVLDTSNPKSAKWTPPPKPPREVFGTCPDCGGIIWKMESCWWLTDKIVCMGCHEEYLERGEGHLDCAGLEFPDLTLEG